MKNLFLFLTLVSLLACSDDPLSDTIVGEWKLSTISVSDCSDMDNNVPQSIGNAEGCLTVSTAWICQTLVFHADGTIFSRSTTNGIALNQTLNYTIEDKSNTGTLCDSINNCSTFILNENLISFTSSLEDCTLNRTYTMQ